MNGIHACTVIRTRCQYCLLGKMLTQENEYSFKTFFFWRCLLFCFQFLLENIEELKDNLQTLPNEAQDLYRNASLKKLRDRLGES